MDFGLSEEQEMLRNAARILLNDKCPRTLVMQMEEDERGFPSDLWQEMAKLGWLGLIYPSEYGGSGGSFLDQTVLLEEMGRVCLPGPYFSTVILGGLLVLEAGSKEQKQEFLPEIIHGNKIISMALTEPSARYDPDSINVIAVGDRDDFIINGSDRRRMYR